MIEKIMQRNAEEERPDVQLGKKKKKKKPKHNSHKRGDDHLVK